MLNTYTQRAGFFSFLVILFEVFWGGHLQVFSFRPDLFLILIIFWAFVINQRTVPQVSLVMGLVRDLLSSSFFGVETLTYFAVGCLVSLLSLKIDRQNLWIRGGVSFLFSFAHFFLLAVALSLTDLSRTIPLSFLGYAFFNSLYTALVALWLIPFLERLSFFRISRLGFNA